MVPRAVSSARPQFITVYDLGVLVAPREHLEILVNIAWMPIHVSALADRLEVDIPHISICLAKFLTASLVTFVQERRFHIYSLGPAAEARFDDDGLLLTVRADDNHSIRWIMDAAEVANLLRTGQRPIGVIGPPKPSDQRLD